MTPVTRNGRPEVFVLVAFSLCCCLRPMSDPVERLTPADPDDLAAAIAFALRYQGRKRVHNADELMAEIVAKRLVEYLERAGFVLMKRPVSMAGGGAVMRGFGQKD
jgi:hypothetical protein